MKPTRLLVLLLTTFAQAQATAAVFRCEQPGQAPQFRQFPCAGGAGGEIRLDPAQIVAMPGLSEHERAALAALQAETDRERAERAEQRARAAHSEQQEQTRRASTCEDARRALASLARTRRKGYSLADARELGREERRQQAIADASCR